MNGTMLYVADHQILVLGGASLPMLPASPPCLRVGNLGLAMPTRSLSLWVSELEILVAATPRYVICESPEKGARCDL